MSKWPTAGLLLLGAAVWLALALLDHSWDRKYRRLGATAQIVPIDSYTETTTTKKHLVKPDQVSVEREAKMSYVDKSNTTVTFVRFLSEETVQKFRSGQPVYVEYIPGEWNSERFKGESSKAWLFALLFLVFVGGAIYVIRRPSPRD